MSRCGHVTPQLPLGFKVLQPLCSALVSGTTSPVAMLIRETKLALNEDTDSISSFGTRALWSSGKATVHLLTIHSISVKISRVGHMKP